MAGARGLVTILHCVLLDRLATRRHVALFLIAALTLLLAFISASSDLRIRWQDFARTRDAGGEFLVLHEPSALSFLARGADEQLDSRFEVDRRLGLIRVTGQSFRPEGSGAFPPIDVLQVVCVILSLVALLLTFDAISGERESGRLTLLFTHPVPRSSLYLGKWLGAHASLAAALLPAFLAGVLWATTIGGARLRGEDWVGLLIFAVLSGAYLSLFLTLGIAVSCVTRRTSTSSVVVFVAWIFLVCILPGLLRQVAADAVALPTTQRMEMVNTQNWIAGVVDRIDPGPAGSPVRQSLAEAVLRTTGGMDRQYFAALSRRMRVLQFLAVLSPASSYVLGATAATATSPEDVLRFKSSLLTYRSQVIGSKEQAASAIWTPRSRFGDRWPSIAQSLATLLAGNALLLILGAWSIRRCDPR